MPLIVVASDKGSPGVTTTAITLAAVWPRRALLAELDPSGGDPGDHAELPDVGQGGARLAFPDRGL